MTHGVNIILSVNECTKMNTRFLFVIAVLGTLGVVNGVSAYREGGAAKLLHVITTWLIITVISVLIAFFGRKLKKREDELTGSLTWFRALSQNPAGIGMIALAIGAVLAAYVIGVREGIVAIMLAALAAILLLYDTAKRRKLTK